MTSRVQHIVVLRLLAATLGEERARTAWGDALRGLSIPADDAYEKDQVVLVLSALSSAPGLVGSSARLAKVQLDGATSVEVADPPELAGSLGARGSRFEHRTSPSGAPGAGTTSVTPPLSPLLTSSSSASLNPSLNPGVDVLQYLVPSLGDEKARDVLQQYAKSLGLRAEVLSREDAVAILDAMSQADGLLGVVARFAKARFVLRYPGPRV